MNNNMYNNQNNGMYPNQQPMGGMNSNPGPMNQPFGGSVQPQPTMSQQPMNQPFGGPVQPQSTMNQQPMGGMNPNQQPMNQPFGGPVQPQPTMNQQPMGGMNSNQQPMNQPFGGSVQPQPMMGANSNTLFSNPVVSNEPQKPENFVMGIVGAAIGALLGSIVLIILYQIGVVAAISGLIMAALAGIGYEKLGGHMSKKGAIASIIVVLVVIFVSYNLAVSIEISGEFEKYGYDVSTFDIFTDIFDYIKNGYIKSSAYWGNLLLVYFFSAMGAVGLLKK